MKYERLQNMKQLIFRKREISLLELCEEFSVSIETVRRDVNILEKEGIVRKIYGGVALADTNVMPAIMAAWPDRVKIANREKTRIAQKAAELIPDGSIIALDSGTTMLGVAHELVHRNDLTIITNSLYNVMEITSNAKHLVYCIGGAVKTGEAITTGFLAADFLDSFTKIDIAVISADGLDLAQGICDFSTEMGMLKRRFLQKSSRAIAVVDYTKFGARALFSVCGMDQIDVLITDAKAPERILSEIRKQGVQVIIA